MAYLNSNESIRVLKMSDEELYTINLLHLVSISFCQADDDNEIRVTFYLDTRQEHNFTVDVETANNINQNILQYTGNNYKHTIPKFEKTTVSPPPLNIVFESNK